MNKLAQFFLAGDIWMVPIAVVSVIALGVTIDRVYFLFFKYRLDGDTFMPQIKSLVMSNQIDRAIKVCNAVPDAPLARVIKSALARANKGETEIRNAIEETILEVMPSVQRRMSWLSSLSSLSTLLGLLGTIMGLIDAFSAVADAPPDQKAALLTKSISVAMNATAFGLCVAIPALFINMFVVAAAKKITEDIDACSVKTENLLVARGKGTLSDG